MQSRIQRDTERHIETQGEGEGHRETLTYTENTDWQR